MKQIIKNTVMKQTWPVEIYASKKWLMKFFIIPVISFEPCLILGKEIDCLPS